MSSRLPLCADVSRALGEDPVGTAPHWQEVTVLELDMAVWAQLRNVAAWTPEQARCFEQLRDKVAATGAGFGLLMCAPALPGQALRVRHYQLRTGDVGTASYIRRDYQSELPQSEWARGLHDTLIDPQRLHHWTEQPAPPGRDIYTCTHGTVDAACGKYGVPVYLALSAGGVRSWRTGHFGGHRFAATAVELPAGLLWAHLTPELALKVMRREVSPAEVRLHLRGFAGLPPLAQILDRELLVRHGWEWLTARRWAEVNGHEVTLHYAWGSVVGAVQARVDHDLLNVPDSSHQAQWSAVKQHRVVWL